MDCRANYLLCIYCDTANGYILLSGQCIQKNSKVLSMISRTVSLTPLIVTIKFSDPVAIDLQSLVISLKDTYDGMSWSGSQFIDPQLNDDGIEVRILVQSTIRKGVLTIDKAPPASSNQSNSTNPLRLSPIYSAGEDPGTYFTDFPITVPGVKAIGSAATKSVGFVIQKTMSQANNARAAATAVLITSNPALSVLLDRMFCDFTYLSLLGSQNLTYPNMIIQLIGGAQMMPFKIPNYFAQTVSDPSCVPTFELSSQNIDCNFLINYGIDTIILRFTLAINTVFSLVGFAIRKLVRSTKISEYNPLIKICYTLTSILGLQYFFLKMDGNSLELVLFAATNLGFRGKMSNDKGKFYGIIFSSIVIGFYCIYALFQYAYIRVVRKHIHTRTHITNVMNAKELQDAYNLTRMKFGLFAYIFEGYSYPISTGALYYPLWCTTRAIITATVLATLGETEQLQLGILLVFEMGGYLAYLVFRVKANKIELFVEGSMIFIRILYICTAMLSFTALGEIDPNGMVGLTMVFLLLSIVVINLCAIVFTIIKITFDFIADRTCRRRTADLVKEGSNTKRRAIEDTTATKPLKTKKSSILKSASSSSSHSLLRNSANNKSVSFAIHVDKVEELSSDLFYEKGVHRRIEFSNPSSENNSMDNLQVYKESLEKPKSSYDNDSSALKPTDKSFSPRKQTVSNPQEKLVIPNNARGVHNTFGQQLAESTFQKSLSMKRTEVQGSMYKSSPKMTRSLQKPLEVNTAINEVPRTLEDEPDSESHQENYESFDEPTSATLIHQAQLHQKYRFFDQKIKPSAQEQI
jgi:hypothetical protein